MKRIGALLFTLALVLFGVTTSHAALYFQHVDTKNGWSTEIGIINPSSTETVTGTLESYSNNGTLVASLPVSLGPNKRRQINVGSELVSAANTGYIVFKNTSGWPVGYTKFTPSVGDRVAIPAADSVNTGNTYVTHIAWAPWWTGISLVNTTAAAKTLTFHFNTGATRTRTLGPREHQSFTVAGLLDNMIDTTIVSAWIENASGIVGLELFGNGSQLGGVPLTSTTASTLFYPHVETNGWWTGIAAYNPSTTATQFTVNPYTAAGNPLTTSTQPLGAGQKYIGASNTLLPATTAWFSLQSQDPLTGFELFGSTDNKRLAGFSAVDIYSKAGIFAKLEKSGWTGIAFTNTENQSATVTLKAYNDAGNLQATGTQHLNAYQKWVGLAGSLFPGVNINTATYISYSADRNVAGFQLNNSSNDALLDALAASSPSGLKVITKALDFFKYQSTLTSGMTVLTDIISQVMGGTGTCPVVTTVPLLSDLSTLPPAITLTANYGSGCTAKDGSTMSGQLVLAVTNLTQTATALNLDFAFTPTNLKRNGVPVLEGSISGHITLNISGENLTGATVNIHFNSFKVAGGISISGNLTITATNLDTSQLTGGITLSFDHLTTAGYAVYSGTVTVTSTSSSSYQMVCNLDTSQGVVNLTLTVQAPSSTQAVVNSTPGTIAGYTVTYTNVTLDTTVCNGYPSSGSVTVSQGGSSVVTTFTPTSCPVSQMDEQMMEPVTPAPDLNPWLNIIKPFYEYLILKR
jgi:hypothetical protein